jgi:hypothetical protein
VFGIDLDLGPAEAAPPAPAKKAAPKPPVPAPPRGKAAREKQARPATVSRAELQRLGVPKTTVAYWARTGVLTKTEAAGVFEQTEVFRERVARYGAAR